MFKNLKIGVKLAIGFGLMIVLLVTVSGLAYIRVDTINGEIENMVNDKFPKVVLANEVTRLCRGDEAAKAAEATAAATFAGGGVGADLPVFALPADGIGIIDALVGIGFAASRGEAKRLVAGGGARVDGESVVDEGFHIPGAREARISSGKKRHGVLRPA